MFVKELGAAVAEVRRLLSSPDLDRLDGDDARHAAGHFAELGRLASSGVALLAPKVAAEGSHAKAGHGSAAKWLESISGTSPTAARRSLKSAETVAGSRAVRDALKAGEVSAAQLDVLAGAAETNPDAVERLLPMVGQVSMRELTDEAARLRSVARGAEGERARRDRVHHRRHLSWHQDPGGGIRGEFLCDEVEWSRVAPGINRRAAQLRREARRSGAVESPGAYRMDALFDLLAGQGSGKARPHTIVVVNAESLRRGETAPGEFCDIDGIGPVSVEAAVELMGEGSVQFLVREGVDIRTITTTSRTIPQRVAMGLLVRDRVCAVPGCGEVDGLQADHCDVDYQDGGPTEMANLARLCVEHHDLKTYGGWRLKGEPGAWEWTPPEKPPSAGFIARARRLAAIKAKAARAGP
jgi:hypothetical protein